MNTFLAALARAAAQLARLKSVQSSGGVPQADSAMASSVVEVASQAARRGGEVVQQVAVHMADIAAASTRIAETIEAVDGIAFQSNLLALNAAVEAARLSQGQGGLAVVANEVRSLAQRSGQAARDIKALIGASVAQVESGAELVAQAGACMTEIVTSIERVNAMMAQLADTSSARSVSLGQVDVAVGRLDQMTQQNAALIGESAAAAAGMREQAQRLARAVDVFRQLDTQALGAAVEAEAALRVAARLTPPAS